MYHILGCTASAARNLGCLSSFLTHYKLSLLDYSIVPLCAWLCQGWRSAGRSLGCGPLSSSISLHTWLYLLLCTGLCQGWASVGRSIGLLASILSHSTSCWTTFLGYCSPQAMHAGLYFPLYTGLCWGCLMASIFHPKHCALDYTVFTSVYKIVLRLRFNREKSGLVSCILYHEKLCMLDFWDLSGVNSKFSFSCNIWENLH